MAHVLIVEDEPIVALDLIFLVTAETTADCIIANSNARARELLATDPDYVLLDINVVDGNTFALARDLRAAHMPFAFVTAVPPVSVPDDLKAETFLPKPYSPSALSSALICGLAAHRAAILH